jgi:hypothetical protein
MIDEIRPSLERERTLRVLEAPADPIRQVNQKGRIDLRISPVRQPVTLGFFADNK